MIDALGFKGIHTRHEPEDVLKAMKASKVQIEREFTRYVESNRILIKAEMSLRYMSDSIIICLQFDKSSLADIGDTNAKFACFTMCELLLVLTSYWAASSIPLAFRGAVSSGYFCSSEEFLVGQAVDDCAQLFEQAQGAFVCISKSLTEQLFSGDGAVKSSNVLLLPFDVPLKDKVTSRMLVLHTGIARAQAEPVIGNHDLQEAILATFDLTRPDVQTKRENTKRFFELGNTFLGPE